MRTVCFALASAFIICNVLCTTAKGANIIPEPVRVEKGTGAFALVGYPRVEVSQDELNPLARYLARSLPGGRVYLLTDSALTLPSEGYRLTVSQGGITILGKDYGGVWNGIQTFLQLFPSDTESFPVSIEAVTIEDYPLYPYRGVMLDVARTFVPKEQVMRLIDNISRYKINKFHWHLADDEGWRVEIKSYPRLTSVGAFRGGFAGNNEPLKAVYGAWDERYGGFYTHDDIREVVAYAAERGVEVIPEIDLPGHSRAAATAYPEILCPYKPSLAASAGYDVRDVWCVAREENYRMLSAIIGELSELFPSPILHLGGDEVSTSQWRHCPDCKAIAAERCGGDFARLEDVFMSRAIAIAALHGKTAGVWNEAAASGEIPLSTMVWGWENMSAARQAVAAGYPTVVCVGEYFYFDQRQGAGDRGHIWAGVVSLEKVYSFDAKNIEGSTARGIPDGAVTQSAAKRGAATDTSECSATRGAATQNTPPTDKRMCGVEATFFSELLLENGLSFLDYQLFPRVCALAEVAWTPPSKRSWSDFERRLRNPDDESHINGENHLDHKSNSDGESPSHYERLGALGVEFCREPRKPVPPPALQTPSTVFTSSLRESSRHPFSGVASYRAAAWSTATATEGDWFLWRFARPVSTPRIEVVTGYAHLGRGGFPQGRVEVSYDGVSFGTVATLRNLKASVPLDSTRAIRAVRVVCDSHGNGEGFVIVQPLKIER